MRRRRLILNEESCDEMEAVTLNQASAAAAEEVQWTWKREARVTKKVNIKLYSRRAIIEQITEELKLIGDGVYQEFMNSCFGFLMRFDTQGVSCKTALHCIFAHEVIKADVSSDELWYRVGGRFIRFSKYEYALVTGLSFGPTTFDPSAEHDPPASGLFLRHYQGQRLKMDTLRRDFTDGVFRPSPPDALKVAKLLIVYFLLFGMDGKQRCIDKWAWTLIEDTDQWETFMWGKYTYQILLRYLQRVPTELSHSMRPTYRLHGYVWAFLIWAYEAIPELGNACGVLAFDDALPRCLRWRFPKTQVDMEGFCDRQMEVHSTLDPSAEEQRQAYWEHIHDDLRSGVCYIHQDNLFKKKTTTSANPSALDVLPVSRPQGSRATPTRRSCSTYANPMKFKKKRKRTDALTTRASLRVADQEKAPDLSHLECGRRDEMTSAIQNKLPRIVRGKLPALVRGELPVLVRQELPELVRQELPSVIHLALKEFFSSRDSLSPRHTPDDLHTTAPISAVGGTSSSLRIARPRVQSRCLRSPVTVFKHRKEDATEADYCRFLKTDEIRNIERLRMGPDFFREIENPSLDMDSEPELSNVAVDQMGGNKLNEKINELKNKNLQNEWLVGVYQEKYKCVDTMVLKMGKEIEELRHEKLAAIKTVEELRLKQLEADKVVEELKRKNLEANLKKLESDKAVELYKSRLENLSSKIMKIEEDPAHMLTVKVEDPANLVNDVRKLATSEGGNLDIPDFRGEKDNSGNGGTPDDAENVVVMSPGVHSTSNSTGSRSSGLAKKGDRNSAQPWTRGEDDAHTVKTPPGSQSRYNPPQAESNDTVKDNEHREPRASDECKGNITTELNGLNDEASTDSDESCTDSRMDDLIASLRSKSLGRKWTYEADLLRAFQQDEQLCMNAVCALYRQQSFARKSKGRSKNGGFSAVDSMSGHALAEYLIDGDGELRLRKSVSEVKKQRPDVISQCRKLATIYIEKLFQIYCSADDPFFGQS